MNGGTELTLIVAVVAVLLAWFTTPSRALCVYCASLVPAGR